MPTGKRQDGRGGQEPVAGEPEWGGQGARGPARGGAPVFPGRGIGDGPVGRRLGGGR